MSPSLAQQHQQFISSQQARQDLGVHSGVALASLAFLQQPQPPLAESNLRMPTADTQPPVVGACYNSLHAAFATASGRDIRVWNAFNGCLLRVFSDISVDDVTAICVGERELKLVVANRLGHITVHNWSTGAKLRSLVGHAAEVSFVWYCALDRVILSCGHDGVVLTHDDTIKGDEKEPKMRLNLPTPAASSTATSLVPAPALRTPPGRRLMSRGGESHDRSSQTATITDAQLNARDAAREMQELALAELVHQLSLHYATLVCCAFLCGFCSNTYHSGV